MLMTEEKKSRSPTARMTAARARDSTVSSVGSTTSILSEEDGGPPALGGRGGDAQGGPVLLLVEVR